MKRSLLTDEQREKIREAVTRAETGTRGEIVPVVLRASDSYPGARWRLATTVAIAATTALAFAWPPLTALQALALLLVALAAGHLIALHPRALRLTLKAREVDEEVAQRARELFLELNLHHTRDRTGVMLLVSMLERRIEILCDTGIDHAAPKGFWVHIVDELSQRIRAGDLAEGMVNAIDQCGELLSEHFPRLPDDTNELPDRVVVID